MPGLPAGPPMGLLGLPAKANIVSAEKYRAYTAFDITFGHWGVPAVLDISTIRTLKVKYVSRYIPTPPYTLIT